MQNYGRFQLSTHNRRERSARLSCRGSVHHQEQRSFQGSGGDSPRHVSDKVSYMPWGADNELHTTADPKFERKIPALIANFCTYYAPHANHSVIYYYDATALDSNYAVNDQDFHWVIVHEFERHGWSVQDVYLGNPMRHDEKYLLINQVFFRQATLDALFQPPNVVQMRTKSNLFKLC